MQDLLQRIEAHRARERELRWEGTFRDYLAIVRKRPSVARHAHARIYQMIASAGVYEKDGVKRYRFFEGELFGLEVALQRLVEEYFHSAARRLDVRKRILLLMGPVSGGKSTLVTMLKRGLEAFTRTDEGAVYGIRGCPMHEEPLHLVPRDLRPEVERELGVVIEGNLCPRCHLMVEQEYAGRIDAVPVERVLFSEEERVGIGTFSPSDPKSQDIADLTGSIDFATIGTYGSESDPRAYRFDGELNKANRGLMEFIEMLKCDEKFLWNLLTVTQEGNFKAGRFALISADEMIIAHTNETEYRTFIANRRNEALQSRIVVMPIPYNLRVSDEVKIYQKLVATSELRHVHLAPHALRVAAIFSVLSRLKESKRAGIDLVKKMKLYDGEEVEGFKLKDVAELQAEGQAEHEGMSGVDPRYVINRISSALVRQLPPDEAGVAEMEVAAAGHADEPVAAAMARARRRPASGTRGPQSRPAQSEAAAGREPRACIHAIDVLRALRDGLDQHSSITREERERLLNFVAVARQEYDELAKKEVQRAFVYSYEESARTLLNNYLDNVEAYAGGTRLRDPITDEELDPDEKLMRGIEEQIGISENGKRAFREEIMIRISTYARRGKPFTYESHERLKEAIEKKLFADLKDVVKITTSAKTPDEQQLKRINEVTARLIEHEGYCPSCANELLRYTGSLLNR